MLALLRPHRSSSVSDAEHTMNLLVWDRRLFNATVIPKAVLNVGTGMGAWAINFGMSAITQTKHAYSERRPRPPRIHCHREPQRAPPALLASVNIWLLPSSDLIVSRVPSNVEFQLERLHQPWTWRENRFDFVCVGNLNHNFADKEHVCRQAFR
jgi:hypothetical protein